MHTSVLTGRQWLDELLTGHPKHFYNIMGIERFVFCKLSRELQLKAGLCGTKHVTADEQLAIFLHL
ncbi:hypothetical protein BV22DRAFT_990648, partial [Leucogyrophana mollusca]